MTHNEYTRTPLKELTRLKPVSGWILPQTVSYARDSVSILIGLRDGHCKAFAPELDENPARAAVLAVDA